MKEKPTQLNKQETKKAHQERIGKILQNENKNHEEKIAALESVKDKAREKLQDITQARGSVNAKHEQFEKTNTLTEKRKRDYDEVLQVLDYKEKQIHHEMRLADQAARELEEELSKQVDQEAPASGRDLAA